MDALVDLELVPCHFTGLALQVLPMGRHETDLDEALYERCWYNFRCVLENFTQLPVTKLSIPGQAATLSPPKRTLRDLTHLALRNARYLGYVNRVFELCVRLESLWISCHDYDDEFEASELFGVLKAHPNALPRLTHLKLALCASHEQSMDVIAAFVAPKKRLRCFDWDDLSVSVAQLSPLLAVFPSLPALEVLGLHLLVDDDDMAEWMVSGKLIAFIPHRATALRFSLDYFDVHVPQGRCWQELVRWYCSPGQPEQ